MIDNLSIVIPFYNGHPSIDRLLASLPKELPVLIVDDAADDPLIRLTTTYIESRYDRQERTIQVIPLSHKGYFAGAVNRGLEITTTDVLVLNQDTWFDHFDFFDTIDYLRREYAFFGERIRGNHPAFGDLGYVHGTCMFMRRDAIRVVGLLNQQDYPLWGNTAEYQWRVARQNFKIFPIKEIPGFHHERPQGERFGSSIKELLQKEPDKRHILVNTPPILSVVVPCYNYGRYLLDCISSLVGGNTSLGPMPGQTLQSFEIVIVDDASTDNSLDFIKEAADISKGIRAYHLEKNVGTARALNYGIERCYGKYITFLSADDMREPDSLAKLVEVCEQNPHSFAYDDVWLFHSHQRIKKWQMEDFDFETLIWKNHVHAGIVFPRAAWQEVGGYPAIMSDGREDWAFNIALGLHGWCGVHLKNYGYLYRREGQNRTETNTTETHRERFLGKIMGLFPEIYKGNRPMACCGKGSNSKTNTKNSSSSSGMTSRISARSPLMAESNIPPVGKEPMESIEYLGGQLNFTITGDSTNAKYTFGKDRPKGWVFQSDVGTRESKLGFLSKRENGKWLYRIAGNTKEAAPEPAVGVEVTADEAAVAVEAGEVDGALGAAETTGLLTATKNVAETKVATPNPTDMTVEELKAYSEQGLTRDQWEEIYKIEMANRNRKGAVAWLEELLGSWSD